MSRRVVASLLPIVLLLTLTACERLPERPRVGEGGLPGESLPGDDTVPAAWGRLVTVTVDPGFGHLFTLWFQDESGTIRIVRYDDRWKRLSSAAVRIERTGGVQP